MTFCFVSPHFVVLAASGGLWDLSAPMRDGSPAMSLGKRETGCGLGDTKEKAQEGISI